MRLLSVILLSALVVGCEPPQTTTWEPPGPEAFAYVEVEAQTVQFLDDTYPGFDPAVDDFQNFIAWFGTSTLYTDLVLWLEANYTVSLFTTAELQPWPSPGTVAAQTDLDAKEAIALAVAILRELRCPNGIYIMVGTGSAGLTCWLDVTLSDSPDLYGQGWLFAIDSGEPPYYYTSASSLNGRHLDEVFATPMQ